MSASDRLSGSENRLQDLRVRQAAGIISAGSDAEFDAMANQQAAEGDFKLLTRKLEMRARFLEGKLTEKEMPATLQLMEAQNTLNRVVLKLQQAAKRAKRAKERAAVGIGTQLDVKRAELDELEISADKQRVQEQLNRLAAAQALKKKN